eukprot:m.184694 g.184694  ORF g.184694 m.184694 type:complete len:736 (+) comp32203_c1_seq1:199-2406(+)
MLRALANQCRGNLRQLSCRQIRIASTVQVRDYNFASSRYVECFGNLPSTDHMDVVRADTISYMQSFDQQSWFNDPVCTIVNGKRYTQGEVVDTTDAFETVVGKLIMSPPSVVDTVIEHMHTFKPPKRDFRKQIRAVEAEMLCTHAATLVGNQAFDFKKQDGITEIEESLEANEVERRLNDALFDDESNGIVEISRAPALVGCVSNFSNFLDLCRKTLRNLELGVPVVILSRSNTTQHMFRWVVLLIQECEKQGLDSGMITYAACSIDEQRRIMMANATSPLYLTGSRPVAAAVKEILPNTFSSTGGPNTMVTTSLDDDIKDAIRMSAMIENSGQCTAMRHLVAPNVDDAFVKDVFTGASAGIESSAESLATKGFAEYFRGWAASFKEVSGYKRASPDVPAAFKINETFPVGIEEQWRRIYLDVTSVSSEEEILSDKFCDDLSEWLVTEQPITLSINRDDPEAGYPLTSKLFEKTCQVVYSVGTAECPSLTCQARPQDGEIFGEFPPRHELSKYTKFPVIVPSPTPGYNSVYSETHLREQSLQPALCKTEETLRSLCTTPSANGYIHLITAYLKDAAGVPHEGYGQRTTLWGLQRPPINGHKTEVRVSKDTHLDEVLMTLVPFAVTNACTQLSISIDPNAQIFNQPTTSDVDVLNLFSTVFGANPPTLESDADFEARTQEQKPWNVVRPLPFTEFNLVGHYISVLFPLGHIKSTKSNDQVFLDHFKQSPKWLRYTQ